MDPLHQLDTAVLVERVRAYDHAAWIALTDRYTGLLWSVARSMRLNEEDAADAVQTTWLRLVERLDTLREPEHVGSWLATTMRRECLVALRRRSRVAATDGWEDMADPAGPLDEALLREERDAALWRAFHALPANCRQLLRVLMADPPPKYAEVAEALGMPIGSIGPTRRRCLDALRDILLSGPEPSDARSPGTARGARDESR
jgi:RNA polymerase sigma factor (sigma-70 family)